MDKIKEFGGRSALVTGVTFGLMTVMGILAGTASATDPVDDAFTSMNAKVTTYGAAIVALVVLSVGIFLGIKYLRKGVSKA